MAVQVKRYEGREIARPQQVVGQQAAVSGVGEVARGMQAVGELFYNFQDEVDTADAKVADSQFAKLVQDALYADGSGYMYTQGSQATSGRQSLVEKLEKERERALSALSPAARARAEQAMTSRMRDATESVNRHAVGQGRAYLNSASEARLSMFTSDAIYKPETSSLELKRAELEIMDIAARNGWSPEVTELKLRESRTAVHAGIVQRFASADAGAALDYLRRHKDEMDGEAVMKLEGALAPMAKEQKGRRAGAAAAAGLGIPKYEYSTQVDYAMGPARPNKPDQAVVDVVGKSVEEVLGKGARIVITSGQENDGHQHGSARHKTGLAADIRIIRHDGSVVKASDPEMVLIAKAAAANGAQGIGYGMNYMGGEHVHIDLIDPSTVGGAHTWEDAKAIQGEIAQIVAGRKASATGGLESIIGIADPTERQAALTEYKLLTGLKQKEVEGARVAAQSAAFQIIEGGGSLSQLTYAQRVAIGQEGMSSLLTYQEKLASGEKIETDDQTYVHLMEMKGTDPKAFAGIDLLQYRDRLSDADFRELQKAKVALMEDDTETRKNALAPMKITEARSAISTALKSAGFDTNEQAGAQMQAKLEAGLLRWSQSFGAQNGRAPDALEINKWVGQSLVSVVVNPSGILNEQSGNSLSINYAGQPVTGAGALTLEQVAQSTIRLGGTKVPQAEIELFIEGYTQSFGVPPTPQQVIEGLIASGRYTQP